MKNPKRGIEGDDTPAGARRNPDVAAAAPVLLYDGLCGFCDRTVRFVLARDSGGTMRFAPLQGEYAAAVLEQYPHLREIDSLVLIEPARDGQPATARVRSDAALAIGTYVGGPWRLAARAARVVPAPIRDAAYDLIARFRYRIFGHFDTCPIPPPAVRDRFLA